MASEETRCNTNSDGNQQSDDENRIGPHTPSSKRLAIHYLPAQTRGGLLCRSDRA
jgi:hypothetical protein